MNRNNLALHLSLAITLILIAAVAGQIRKMKTWESPLETDLSIFEGLKSNEDRGAEVLVRFRKGLSQEELHRLTTLLNDEVEDRVESVDGLVVISDRDGKGLDSVIADYSALEYVEYVEPNTTISLEPTSSANFRPNYTTQTPDDPMFEEQWALNNTGQREGKPEADIRALDAWSKSKGDESVVVAVLDSGVDYTHPDLVNNTWIRPSEISAYSDKELGTVNDRRGFNAISHTGDPMDENGHGTHCAGIIGAEGGNGIGIVGVNWKVRIMPLKFMSAGGFGTTKDAIECINYVIDRKKAGVNVRVISASWGSAARSKALEDVIRRAGEEGILFVAASGNSSADADRYPHFPAGYALPNVLSVAALSRNDELASFSNFGANSVHIAAPGAEVLSTWLAGSYEEHSGTSMATPYVAGVAALILSREPDMTINVLRNRLLNSADKLGSLEGKVVSSGRINASRALD
jgi:thermitase